MRLISLSLQNFRQHAASFISFAPGLTGIIGANGSGKSTILEGIAFALYGQPAARGKKESIKFQRALARATVRVELTFEIAGHRYRVVRGLSSAECYLDEAEAPIANTLTGVTDMLQRVLGMTRDEFFATYFTGQKELAMMASMSPGDRGKFLSRVLGYDRLQVAQESVRDRRRSVMAELGGMRLTMQDGDAVAQAVRDAQARVDASSAAVLQRTQARDVAAAELHAITPLWEDVKRRHERARELTLSLATARQSAAMHQRDIERLTAELADVDAAAVDVEPLRERVADLPAHRDLLRSMDEQASAEATRQNLLGVQATLQQTLAELTAASGGGADDVDGMADRVGQLRDEVRRAEARYDDARDAWTRASASARADVEALRDQHEALVTQKAQLEALGEASPCSACGQRLGARFASAVRDLTAAIDGIVARGIEARARLNGLSAAPAEVTQAQAERGVLLISLQQAERTLAERSRVERERQATAQRLATIQQSLSAMTGGYDSDAHRRQRALVEQLVADEARLQRLEERIARGVRLRDELLLAERALTQTRQHAEQFSLAVVTEGVSPEAFARTELEFLAATTRAQETAQALASVQAERQAAEESLGHHRAAQARHAALCEAVATREHERRVLDEADRGYTDLRSTLNAALRPELAEIASELLDTLTDGRYTQADVDETYSLVVLEDGIAKPVLSGGEEDLCNLVMRLAISQMIAQRAGHAFSLLILDEVFGALDDNRRANVMDLLRRLNDRFAQVIVITHITQVRDGVDQLMQVRYDPETGASALTTDDGPSDELAQRVAFAA